MTVMLEAKDLQIFSATGPIVRETSLVIEEGSNLTILGETGSGKSLLAQAIMGTLPAGLSARGEITIGREVSKASDFRRRHRLWGRTLAILPQEPWLSLDPTMPAINQVAEGFLGESPERAHQQAREALRALGLAGAERLYPFKLSGGMAQRVALAATEAGGASLLIVDEPTKGLDAALRDSVVTLLHGVAASGRTLLTITHDVLVARSLGGRILVMLNGEIVEEGAADDVLSAPRHAYTKRLLAAEPHAWPKRTIPLKGAPLLVGSNLAKTYGDKRLFQNLNITVHAGQRMAVTGPSGSGKTTVGNILLGLVRADAGGIERSSSLPKLAFQKLYQDPVSAFPTHATLRESFNDLIARHKLDSRELERLMIRLRLSDQLLRRHPHEVSGGELQRFALIRLLLISPAFIFADEPTSRLDLISQQETIDLLVEHAEERNCALLLVTHDPEIAANVAGNSLIHIDRVDSRETRTAS